MANPHYIPEEFRTEFSNSVEYAIQQDQSILFPKAKVDNFKGKEKVYTKQTETEMVRRTGRLRQTVLDEATFENRKAYKEQFVKHFVFDEWDEELLGDLGRPDSETVQNLKMAWERAKDDAIISASTGIVYGGVRPHNTEIPLPDSQKVAVNYKGPGVTPANIGLVPQKLIRACSIFEENELDPLRYKTYVTINPKAKESLLQAVESAPNEVWAKMCIPWLEGKESKLFGLIPVMTNRLTNDSGTDVDTLFAWNEMKGIWTASEKLTIKMSIRDDLEHALQISAYGQLSAHRHDEKAVVQISCDRSPA
jgi:hypothetical protein